MRREDTSRCHERSKVKNGFLAYRDRISAERDPRSRAQGPGLPRGSLRGSVEMPRADRSRLCGTSGEGSEAPTVRGGSVLVGAHDDDPLKASEDQPIKDVHGFLSEGPGPCVDGSCLKVELLLE